MQMNDLEVLLRSRVPIIVVDSRDEAQVLKALGGACRQVAAPAPEPRSGGCRPVGAGAAPPPRPAPRSCGHGAVARGPAALSVDRDRWTEAPGRGPRSAAHVGAAARYPQTHPCDPARRGLCAARP